MNTAWIVALSLVAAGGPSKDKPATAPTPTAPGTEVWRLSLRDAIRIGLENSPVLRVVGGGDAIRIAQADADASAWTFRAAVMAHVRSVEQQYWALSEQQIQLWSREKAVELLEGIVARERADDLGHGATADVAEAQQRLEQARLALVTATSDTITTERQLRNILGLPAVDGRRIVAATPPVEAKVEPDWDRSLAAMMAHQPDILQQRESLAKSEGRVSTATDSAKSPAPPGLPGDVVDAFAAQSAKVTSDRQRVFLKQVTHQATHSMARFFLEIDANYKQFQTAKRLREAAQARLAQTRAHYEEGRTGFSIDKLLDAVGQYSDAVAQEAQYKASYNTAIAALEEAKGTLLAADGIEVVDSKPREAGSKAVGGFEPSPITRVEGAIDVDVKPADFPRSVAPKPEPREPAPAGRVIKYDVSIEGGPLPIGFKGTVSIGTPDRR